MRGQGAARLVDSLGLAAACYGGLADARSERGFTLTEILVVIVVLAVLASFVAPNVFTHVGEAKHVTARSQIERVGTGRSVR
jgi:prepilin-type N-terminal cleavage/methylation domain-containing protein